ncbi:MAG: penicillin-insensitive murein endopeptidase [Hyphomicrobiaceae bacterium]
MRTARFLLAIAMVTTGAVIARPDDLAPLASKIAAPFTSNPSTLENVPASQQAAAVPEAPAALSPTQAPELPSFVATDHALTFKGSAFDAPPTTAGDDAVSAPTTSADATPARPAHTRRSIQLTPVPDDPQADKNAVESRVPSADVDPIKAALNSRDASGKASPAQLKTTAARTIDAGDGTKIIPAKMLFASAREPSPLQSRAIGYYSRGCLAGGVALPVDGPAWQAMRLSRNRNWGHPVLIKMIEDLAVTARAHDDWPGLLVGDISQPRGGPMLTGHASHQMGLDADIWLTPMPNHTLSRKERENISATSMLDKTSLAVNPKVFSDKQVRLIKRAASYPQVERVLVHPAIKKALCEAAGPTDRAWLGKVRPYYGHYYHMHIRIGCPSGSAHCRAQHPVTGNDGCGKEVDDWLAMLARPPKPAVPGAKKKPPKLPLMLTQLPAECKVVLESGKNGVSIPPEAMVDPAKIKPSADNKKSNLVLKPVKERRAHTKREANVQ